MSLEKAIEHGKEHRKPYHGSKAFDRNCRNHGNCPWCEKNRKYKNLKREQKAMAQLEDLMNEDDYIHEEEKREKENLREKQQSKDLEEDWNGV